MLPELTRRRPTEIVRASLLFAALALITIFGALDSDPLADIGDLDDVTTASAELDDGPTPTPPSFTPLALVPTGEPLLLADDAGPAEPSLEQPGTSHRSHAILRLAPKQSPPTTC